MPGGGKGGKSASPAALNDSEDILYRRKKWAQASRPKRRGNQLITYSNSPPPKKT